LPGLQLEASWHIANEMDDTFGAVVEYARDPQFGFLTSSLSNCGTGLRLSVMLHLPALAFTERLEEKLTAARALGVTVRGLFGEHSDAVGNVYQVSNSLSLGLTEKQIVARLAAVSTLLVTDEEASRELLRKRQRCLIEDSVKEAGNALKTADHLSASESMSILSMLRLGELLELSTGMTVRVFNELLASMRIGAAFITGERAQYTFYEETRRPALIRNKLRELKR
jgi:protein arginine kinase